MRYILMLALFFTCLSTVSAPADPLTKRNYDANTRANTRVPDLWAPPPFRQIVKPAPEDLGPPK